LGGLPAKCGSLAKVAVALTLAAILRNGQPHLEKSLPAADRRAAVVTQHLPLVLGTIGELHGNTNRYIRLANGHGV
jgi:hypothetical protein